MPEVAARGEKQVVSRGVIETLEAYPELTFKEFYSRMRTLDYTETQSEFMIGKLDRKELTIKEDLEEIGVDASTGYVVYYNKDLKNYPLIDARFFIMKELDRLSITVTFSVDTHTKRSHEPLTCEVAAHTSVIKKGAIGVDRIIGELEDFVDAALSYYFNEAIADISIKEGVEYLSERPTDEENYPEMKIYLSYANPGKRPKVIEKTWTQFAKERKERPFRTHMDKGGRPKKIKEFV